MKQRELEKCALCGLGVMHAGCPVFYRVKVERMVVDMGAVNRRHGLELMTGSPVLAAVFGTDEDIAKTFDSTGELLVCMDCATRQDALMLLTEVKQDDAEEDTEDADGRLADAGGNGLRRKADAMG
jgi:hypothetical protein